MSQVGGRDLVVDDDVENDPYYAGFNSPSGQSQAEQAALARAGIHTPEYLQSTPTVENLQSQPETAQDRLRARFEALPADVRQRLGQTDVGGVIYPAPDEAAPAHDQVSGLGSGGSSSLAGLAAGPGRQVLRQVLGSSPMPVPEASDQAPRLMQLRTANTALNPITRPDVDMPAALPDSIQQAFNRAQSPLDPRFANQALDQTRNPADIARDVVRGFAQFVPGNNASQPLASGQQGGVQTPQASPSPMGQAPLATQPSAPAPAGVASSPLSALARMVPGAMPPQGQGGQPDLGTVLKFLAPALGIAGGMAPEQMRKVIQGQAMGNPNNPNSLGSQRARQTALMVAPWLKDSPGFESMTQAMLDKNLPEIVRGRAETRTEDRQAAQQEIENRRLEATDRAQTERERADRAREEYERNRVEHPNANKPAPEQEVSKIINMMQAAPIIDNLKKLHGQIGASAVIPGVGIGASGRYRDALRGNETLLAAGLLPQGRETPGSAELVRHMMPSELESAERAGAAFDSMKHGILSSARNKISALRSAGYKSEQLDDLERQLDAAEFGSSEGRRAPVQSSPAVSPAQGPMVRVRLKNGKVGKMPASQVQRDKAKIAEVLGPAN